MLIEIITVIEKELGVQKHKNTVIVHKMTSYEFEGR